MLGIGAAQARDSNGIAWKQNHDFEDVLKRLNERVSTEIGDGEDAKDQLENNVGDGQRGENGGKKRKRISDGNRSQSTQKKIREARKDDSVDKSAANITVQRHRAYAMYSFPFRPVLIPNSHRARVIASKNLASKSPAAISEILGIAASSAQLSPASTPPGTLTVINDDATLEKLTTSTKSVADYFKDKLSSKAASKATSARSSEHVDDNGAYDAPPRGIGASRSHSRQPEMAFTSASTPDTDTLSQSLKQQEQRSSNMAIGSEKNGRKRSMKSRPSTRAAMVREECNQVDDVAKGEQRHGKSEKKGKKKQFDS
jgi:Pin2-interacting protein X1